jgi:hypothetical protein
MTDGVPFGSPLIGSEDIVSLAVQHASGYGMYMTVLYAGYEFSNRNEKNAVNNFVGQEIFSAGAKVTGMGAGFGLGYGYAKHDAPPGMQNDRQWADAALTNQLGPWGVSGGALWIEDEEGGGEVGEAWVYSGSFDYNLAPGLSIMGGVSHHILDNTDFTATNFAGPDFGRADTEATTFTLSTQVTF